MPDTSGIYGLVARGRRRLKLQSALETATLAVVPAAALALVAVYLVRRDMVSPGAGVAMLCGSVGVVLFGAFLGSLRRYPSHIVATRIDRASGLSDRLANACAFDRRLGRKSEEAPETVAMMQAALRDAVASIPKADVKKATPFKKPRELKAALSFSIVCAFVAGLYFPRHTFAPLVAQGNEGPAAKHQKPKHPVVFDEDDIEFQREIVDNLRETSEETGDQRLEKLADEVDDLLDKAERGEISKKEMLEKLAKAQDKYMEGSEENVQETMSELAKTGRELKKNKLTRELGKAMEKGDLEKAQKQLEKLAQKLESGELNDRQQQKLSKALEKAAEKFEKRMKQKDARLAKKIGQKEQELQRLKKKIEQAKNEKQKQELTRRMKRKKHELKRLKRKKEQQQKSAHRRQLKQLHRNMRQASRDMQRKGQKNRRQAARHMRDMSRNTGRINGDRRRIANQKKVASQLTDLKEAMRRAKQRRKGMRDRFGRNRKNNDFRRRARGRRGKREAWKPGSGQKMGKNGKGNRPGHGKGKGGQSYGDEHDPNIMGDPTAKGGHTKDEDVQGVQGREGESVRETILSSAEKGFATRAYKDVYTRYKTVVEEVIKSEKVPSGYKYYVKKYFLKIKPHAM